MCPLFLNRAFIFFLGAGYRGEGSRVETYIKITGHIGHKLEKAAESPMFTGFFVCPFLCPIVCPVLKVGTRFTRRLAYPSLPAQKSQIWRRKPAVAGSYLGCRGGVLALCREARPQIGGILSSVPTAAR